MSAGLWEEEALVMNGEIREAFDRLERKVEEESGKTRAVVRELESRLNAHLIESAVTRARAEEHITRCESRVTINSKWVWGIIAGIIIALAAALIKWKLGL